MNSFSHNMSSQEQAIKSFLHDYSNKPIDCQTIHCILSETCCYYDADRSFTFELNDERTHISNTYEWCRDGVSPAIDNLQNISLDGIEFWLEELEKNGEIYIFSLQEKSDLDSMTYRLLKSLKIDSVAAVPLVVNGSVVGFLGVSNPRRNTGHLLLMSVIASACYSEIVNKRLENSNKALIERMKIIQSMSEIYTSVYYIDISNNFYTELSSVDAVHEHIDSYGNARKNLEFFCRNMMIPEYTEEMLEFVDISTLNERIKHERIISRQFLCTVPLIS